jgi:purine-nucleoside phosphorylase
MDNEAVVLMSGRSHFYEGYSIERITYPVRVFQRLGVQTVIITNAAGGYVLYV